MKKHTLLTLFLFLSCSSVFAQESDTLLVNVMAVLRIIDGQVDTVHITQDTLHTHSDENHAGMVVNLESESETLEEIAYLPSQKELDSLRILELDPNDEVDILEI